VLSSLLGNTKRERELIGVLSVGQAIVRTRAHVSIRPTRVISLASPTSYRVPRARGGTK